MRSDYVPADENAPYAPNDPTQIQRRLGMLHLPHMRPLTEYLDEVKRELGSGFEIPHFDPCDGGAMAKVLFLLEAPGAKAVSSNFVSRNNPDPTAKNMCELLWAARVLRQDTVLWNIVPWYVSTNQRIRPMNRSDIARAVPYLKKLISLFTQLKVVVLVGRKAQAALPEIQELTDLPIYATYHPSARVFHVWPEKRRQVETVFDEVAHALRSAT